MAAIIQKLVTLKASWAELLLSIISNTNQKSIFIEQQLRIVHTLYIILKQMHKIYRRKLLKMLTPFSETISSTMKIHTSLTMFVKLIFLKGMLLSIVVQEYENILGSMRQKFCQNFIMVCFHKNIKPSFIFHIYHSTMPL